jgi:hypothetical protein
VSAAEQLAEARTALDHGAHKRACDLAWRAAASAARVGNAGVLEQVVELANTLPDRQLRVYAEVALEDARKGTRPPSAFERLISRAKRPG